FLPKDLKLTKVSQLYILSDPEFTFIEKFLEKREQQRLSQSDLLVMDTTAEKTTKDMTIEEKFEGYYHVFSSQYFRNSFDEVVVDFFDLLKLIVAEGAIVVVNKYYSYNLNKDNKLHQFKEFKKKLVEHFGAFTGNNNELYTTTNTASNYCLEYRKCVQELISELQSLSNAVNSYFQEIYLYTKMAKLDLGPNVSKSFVCPLGLFKGEQLVFPKLKLIIYAKQDQAVAFRSNILVHGICLLFLVFVIVLSFLFIQHQLSKKENLKLLFHNTNLNNLDSKINAHDHKGFKIQDKPS
ncbi:43076_t:CDS:2, partial [Gigaspora margarita]